MYGKQANILRIVRIYNIFAIWKKNRIMTPNKYNFYSIQFGMSPICVCVRCEWEILQQFMKFHSRSLKSHNIERTLT